MNNFQTIVLQFCLTSGQKFFIQSNSNETLSQIFNRLKQVNNLQIQVGCLIANANKIDLDKTISELNIQNNQLILIIPKFNEPDNEIKSEYKLNKDEMMLIRKWKAEFKEKQLLEEAMKKLNKEKKILHNIDNNISSEKNFEDYLQNKDEISSIQVNEHQHGLFYTLFNFFYRLIFTKFMLLSNCETVLLLF